MQYRPEIDGLRAVAVLPVILFHAGFPVFSGGYVGVDVFFVISGYLITSILIADLEQGSFSMLVFYERRARRILPALFVVILACLPFAYMWMLPAQLQDFAQSTVAAVLSVSNLFFLSQADYFAPDAELQPLLHTWSLAIEEQYYLLFPLLLIALRRQNRHAVATIISILVFLSFLFSEWGWRENAQRNFFFTFSRFWELGIGSICAFITFGTAHRSSNVLSSGGLLLILFAVFYYDASTPFPSAYALAPVLGTALVILFGTAGTWVSWLLSKAPFVGLGLISYSAYLWHQPLFAFARLRSLAEPNQLIMAALTVAALLLAWVTWRYIEAPFRRRKNPVLVTRRRLFATSGFVGAVIVAVCLAALIFHVQLREIWLRHNPVIAAVYLQIEKARLYKNFGATGDEFQRIDDCRFNISNLNDQFTAEIRTCGELHGQGVLILGDSHAIDLFGMTASRFDEPFIIGVTQGGCRPDAHRDRCQYGRILEFVRKNPNIFTHIIYSQSGLHFLLDSSGKKIGSAEFSDIPMKKMIEGVSVDAERVARTYNYLQELAEFTNVTWFGPRIEPYINEKTILKIGCQAQFSMRPGQANAFVMLDSYIGSFVNKDRDIAYFSQIQSLNFNVSSDFMNCDDLYFDDTDHYSSAGEVRFGARLPDNFLFGDRDR